MRESATIDVPPLCVRAEVATVNEAARTVEIVFTTGAPVERMDWWTGKRYIEKLSLKPEHIKLDRLNAGAPLLDAHSAYSITDQIGTVEPNSVRLLKNEARATVRFSKRETVEPIWQDVKDGIYKSVSVGYRVFEFQETEGKKDDIPTRLATSWMPYEVSLVPMPADIGARVRKDDPTTNACTLITRSAEDAAAEESRQAEAPLKESKMAEETKQSEFIAEPNPLDPGAPLTPQQQRQTDPAATEPNPQDLGAEIERARVQGIISACRAARMPQARQDELIRNGTPLLEAQTIVLRELESRDPGIPRINAVPTAQMGDDPLVHVRKGVENAILHRVAPNLFKLDDVGRNYRGLSLLEVGKMFLQAQGVRTTAMTRMEIAGLALGLNMRAGGMHTTSDFALLLADVASKTLRKAYDEAPQTFTVIGRRVTLPDFKPVKRLQLGDAPELLAVNEHGEYTRGTIGEGKEQFQLASYGRIFAITRQALVNDDTDAFSRIPMLFGRAARNLESNLAWQQITSNPTMGDGNALFSAAHSNLALNSSVISIASVGAARAAMRLQTGQDGATLVNVTGRYLLVPPSLETVADQLVGPITPATVGTANPFSGRLTVLAEPRLETASPTAWYIAASPDQLDMLEFAYLEGEDGPMVESRVGFDIDGVEIKARHDFAAKVIDWRGLYLNEGAATT